MTNERPITVEKVRRHYKGNLIAGTPATYRAIAVLLAEIDQLQLIVDQIGKDRLAAYKADVRANAHTNAQRAEMVNQCDGCRRGLPLNRHNHHILPSGLSDMSCTANRYAP